MDKPHPEVKDECNNVVKMLDLQHRKEVCGVQTIFNQMVTTASRAASIKCIASKTCFRRAATLTKTDRRDPSRTTTSARSKRYEKYTSGFADASPPTPRGSL